MPKLAVSPTVALNKSDWSRVLTTSNGEVTIAPHIPPSLQNSQLLAHEDS